MKTRVIVVDTNESSRKLLEARLEHEGFTVVATGTAAEAQAACTQGVEPGILITELVLPSEDGFKLMQWARQNLPQTRIITMGGSGQKETAIKAFRAGATEYFEKPLDIDELVRHVHRTDESFRLERENRELMERLQARVTRVEGKAEDAYWYVSKSPSMKTVTDWLTALRRNAMRGNSDESAVLITGECGTGKEGIARMIHAGSRRAHGPWLTFNCANFPEEALEAELFGHEKGGYDAETPFKPGLFDIARGGTLFIDGISHMDLKLQAKLLEVLQEHTYRRVGGNTPVMANVRVIAATNRPLADCVQAGRFNEELYLRLSSLAVEVPALRERHDDILPMAVQFAERAFRSYAKKFEGFDDTAKVALESYYWPGNVHELLHVIERTAVTWTGSGPIMAAALAIPSKTGDQGPRLELVPDMALANVNSGADSYTTLKKRWTESFEREYLVAMLTRYSGNVSSAAREARIDRSNFLRLLRKYHLRAEDYRKTKDAVAVVTPKAA